MESAFSDRWIVGVTGGSGMPYALRLIEVLAQSTSEVHVIFSEAALRVLKEEMDMKFSPSSLDSKSLLGTDFQNIIFHNHKDIGAEPASGSARFKGMVICPCSMATLGYVAAGIGANLLHRAADATLKEGRKLIIVPRETPLSSIHLENMLKLSRIGVQVVPAMPGFYHKPKTINDLVDMMVMKILDTMGIENSLVKRWKEGETLPQKEEATVVRLVRDGI